MVSLQFLLLSVLSSLAAALPVEATTSNLSPRCGDFKAWDSMFILDESRPDSYLPINNYLFQVYQYTKNINSGRQYLLVHFPPTPYGSYGCELHWNIPANTAFLNYTGSHQLDVKTTTGYYPPFRPTWNTIIKGNPPTLGTGVFGTVNAIPGTSAVINTAACSNGPPAGAVGGGFGLGFVFKFADWVEQSKNAAGVSFYAGYTGPAGVFKGPYLNYNC